MYTSIVIRIHYVLRQMSLVFLVVQGANTCTKLLTLHATAVVVSRVDIKRHDVAGRNHSMKVYKYGARPSFHTSYHDYNCTKSIYLTAGWKKKLYESTVLRQMSLWCISSSTRCKHVYQTTNTTCNSVVCRVDIKRHDAAGRNHVAWKFIITGRDQDCIHR